MQNENENLIKKINESKEKLNDSETINNKISNQIEDMRNIISKIEAKTDEYSQTILYETQNIVQKQYNEYPINLVIQLPPAITFSAHKNDQTKEDKKEINNNDQKTETGQSSEYHPVRRVLIPPPK